MKYEKDFIIANDCIANTNWYNKRVSTFDRFGLPSISKGRSQDNTKMGITQKLRYGNGFRTPAQIEGAKSMRKKLTGVKNPAKGKSGINNSGFKEWYSISPNGVYSEHFDITKADFAKKIGVTTRQITHRFHYTNEHKKATTAPLKGWVFGNLPKP